MEKHISGIFYKHRKYNIKLRFDKKGGIFMRHGSKGKPRDIISMEEYLKKRQAINSKKYTKKEGQPIEAAALQLADLLYV